MSENNILPPNIQPTGLAVNVSAPGKVILHGEHSVVYGKLALTASLGLRSRIKLVEINAPNLAIVQMPILDFTYTYDLEKLKEHLVPPLPLTHTTTEFNWECPEFLHHDSALDMAEKFVNHTTGTATLNSYQKMALSATFFLVAGILGSVNVELRPFVLSSDSELGIGSGTGSSASFSVSLAAALIQYVKLRLGSSGDVSKEGYKPCYWEIEGEGRGFSRRELDMICKWAYCAEKIIHGTPSGVDNTICTYGGIVEFRKGLAPKLLEISRPLKVLLINTNVQRETKRLVSKVASLHAQYPDLTNNILNAMEDVAFIALQHLSSLCSTAEGGDEQVRGHYEELGRLTTINQNLLSALGVSHLKLDEAIHILAENGLHGKLTGAGGGGYAICLVPPYVGAGPLEDAMRVLISRGFQVIVTDLGGRGVTVD